ncbi:MAG: cytochrome c [Paracoccaceae bacterium]|nr:cytochrome c [Paracoccaceae bacterium]
MKKTFATLAALAMLSGTAAYAQDFSAQLKARQGQFRIMAINLGILGGMAKGEVEYTAEAAQAAADTLVAVSMIQQGPHWPAGSSEMDIDGTRAKAEIWDNLPDVLDKWAKFGEAAKVMQTAAGEGPASIGPALGQMGGTCKACHDAYRAPAS